VIPSVHVKTIHEDRVPPEYVKQVQWGLACGRKWCDFVSYCPEIKAMPIFIKRMMRDDGLIAELDKEADLFLRDMYHVIKTILKETRNE
jgi:hypothetical protein